MKTSKAYKEGFQDGMNWDLSGFESIQDVINEPEGWDEATINAVGFDWLWELYGRKLYGREYDVALKNYNRGAHSGAVEQARNNSPGCFKP